MLIIQNELYKCLKRRAGLSIKPLRSCFLTLIFKNSETGILMQRQYYGLKTLKVKILAKNGWLLT